MRRKDREMDRDFGYYVIDKAPYGNLALYGDKYPYLVPLSLIRIGDKIYFHSAKEGEKIDLFQKNKYVSLSFVTDLKIPENYSYEELLSFKDDQTKRIKLISSVFTTEFASCLVEGSLKEVEDRQLKIEVLRKICQKYTPSKMEFFDLAIDTGLSRVAVFEISMDSISSKRKKYDQDGLEMKFMRKK